MVQELISLLLEIPILENTLKGNQVVKVNILGIMELFIKVISKME
jgi:hypothetical protein